MSLELHETGSYTHPDDPGEPSTKHPRLSVTDEEAHLLKSLVVGKTVLEVGTGLGVSTRALAQTAREVHTVDVDPWVWDNIWPYLPDNVVTHESLHSVPEVDAAFIDGDHHREAVERDLRAVEGVPLVIVHDTNADAVFGALGDGWEFFETTHGVGVWRDA